MVCIERLLVVPATLSKPSKRWRLAFATIYCSRTIFLLAKIPIFQLKRPANIPSSPSYTSLNINLDTYAIGTDKDGGIYGSAEDIARRQQAFGSSTLRSAFSCIRLKEGWYDGGSIFVGVFLVIVLCYKLEVPADELFIDGHSLQIDESSMTGESDDVEINHNKNPFLVSGTKVADGYGQMLVTSVGMNTTWGEMMCHISRETDEQTPLQARLNKLTSSIDKSGNKEFDGSKTKADDIVNAVVGIELQQ
ncbi:hypothetical protein OIU78_004597 [Salix suchowensis]|nr:hypothetical protein OIU78_004597 [Salix suchowensis]